jgi:fermentation-respiration switch protein FrsA (DUF1100 family)
VVRSTLLSLLALAALVVAAWWLLAFFAQRGVMFPRSAIPPVPPAQLARLGGEGIWLELADGRAEAFFLPGRTAGGPLLLFAHGNAELIDHWAEAWEAVRARGASLLLVEYPGYGRSEGTPSEASIREAMIAAYDWAVSEGIAPERIVGWGRSLGGGALCALARERALSALILESTFTSARSMAASLGVPGFLVRDPFDNLSLVREFRQPLLLLHGERDRVIPVRHAHALSEAASGAKLVLMPCGHNDCPRPTDTALGFLSTHGLLP